MGKAYIGNTGKRLLLALVCLAALVLFATGARADDNVPYLDATGTPSTANNVTVHITLPGAALTSGWHMLSGTIFGGSITIADNATVHLILEDGCNVTLQGASDNAGLQVGSTETLYIYAQSAGTGTLTATGGDYGAGIGGGYNTNGGTITINGGNVTAYGGIFGAGIGGGRNAAGGSITINDGDITATGGGNSAGIGGGAGAGGAGGTIIIEGGNVTAYGGTYGAGIGGGRDAAGGSITIKGGIVQATGYDSAAGIGTGGGGQGGTIEITDGQVTANGGESGIGIGCSGAANITISGGTIIANGGTLGAGAGIGGGNTSASPTITINGGNITATGGTYGAGIGGSNSSSGGTIKITNGTIIAYGGDGYASYMDGNNGGAGIGGSGSSHGGSGGSITIEGGDITASGGALGGAGIGGGAGAAGGTINVSNGTVRATGGTGAAGIGGGKNGNAGTITVDGGDITANAGGGSAAIGTGQGGGSGSVAINGGTLHLTASGDHIYADTVTAQGGNFGSATTKLRNTAKDGENNLVYIKEFDFGSSKANAAIDSTYFTTDPKLATVDTAGTATDYGLQGVVADAYGKVYFYLPNLNSLVLNKSTTTLTPTNTDTLTVTGVSPSKALWPTSTSITWASNNESVATVNSSTGEVTAVAYGTATVTATGNGKSGACTVIVHGSALVKPTISGAVTINYNETTTLSRLTEASGGSGGPYTYRWQVSTDDTNWTDIPGATGTTYTTPQLTTNTYYRLVARDSNIPLPSYDEPSASTLVTVNTLTPGNETITVTSDPAAGGTTATSVGSAAADGTSILTATPNTNYQFDGWEVTSGNATLVDDTSASITFTMPNPAVPVTIKAKYSAIQYTTTATSNPVAGGTTTAIPATAAAGTNIALSANPDPGYQFDGWTVNSGGVTLADDTSPNTSFTMPGNNVNVTANYSLLPPGVHTIVIAANPAAGGQPRANVNSATAGTTITLSANPNTGYRFDGWAAPGVVFADATDPGTTFTMLDTPVTITANYTYTGSTTGGTDTGDGYSPTFTSGTLTDNTTGVRVSGNNIDPFARLRVTQGWLHDEGSCPACDEIRRQQAAGNVLALYDISLTGYHTGAYELFIPFTGNTGQSYTTLHCLKGTLEQRTAPYQGGGTTTTWSKLSPFAVIKGTDVYVPDNIVVDPPKTGSGNGHGMLGMLLIVCSLVSYGILSKRRSPEKGR